MIYTCAMIYLIIYPEGQLDCIQLYIIVNNATINILVRKHLPAALIDYL